MSMTLCESPVRDETISSSADVESAQPFSQHDESQSDCEQIELQTAAETRTTDRKKDAVVEPCLFSWLDVDYEYDDLDLHPHPLPLTPPRPMVAPRLGNRKRQR